MIGRPRLTVGILRSVRAAKISPAGSLRPPSSPEHPPGVLLGRVLAGYGGPPGGRAGERGQREAPPPFASRRTADRLNAWLDRSAGATDLAFVVGKPARGPAASESDQADIDGVLVRDGRRLSWLP